MDYESINAMMSEVEDEMQKSTQNAKKTHENSMNRYEEAIREIQKFYSILEKYPNVNKLFIEWCKYQRYCGAGVVCEPGVQLYTCIPHHLEVVFSDNDYPMKFYIYTDHVVKEKWTELPEDCDYCFKIFHYNECVDNITSSLHWFLNNINESFVKATLQDKFNKVHSLNSKCI